MKPHKSSRQRLFEKMIKQKKFRRVDDQILTLDGIISPAKRSPRGYELTCGSTRTREQNNRNFTDDQNSLMLSSESLSVDYDDLIEGSQATANQSKIPMGLLPPQ